MLGDSVTTDHISLGGRDLKKDLLMGRYPIEHGVDDKDFNSYGSRRGNHEVMSDPRQRAAAHRLAPGTEGGFTTTRTERSPRSSRRQRSTTTRRACWQGEHGAGSSRDWAGQGPRLLGVRFVIVESHERIHRSNLVENGAFCQLQFPEGESAESLGLTGEEIARPSRSRRVRKTLEVTADGKTFAARVMTDTPNEAVLPPRRHSPVRARPAAG